MFEKILVTLEMYKKMKPKSLSRRDLLKAAGMVAGGAALAACGPQATPEAITVTVKETVVVEGESKIVEVEKVVTAAPPDREPVEITWWQTPIWRYAPDNTTVLGAGSDAKGVDLVNRFQEMNPWVRVKMELIPWDQWPQKKNTGFASGEVGNVMYQVGNASVVESGLLEPVDDYLTEEILSDWLPGMRNAVSYGGRTYGIPMFTNPHFTTFSQTSLEKFGCADLIKDIGEDRAGVTHDLMREYGMKYGDKKSRYFFGVPTDHGSLLYWMYGSWLEGWGVKAWDDTEERWQVADFDESVQAMEWLVKAADDGILPPGNMLAKWSDCDNLFWAENLGGRLQWPGMQAELEVAQSAGQASADFKLLFAAFPHKTGMKAKACGTDPGAYYIGRTTDPSAREASFMFAYFMVSEPTNAYSILTEGLNPVYKKALDFVKDHPRMSDPNTKWMIEHHSNYEPEIPGGNWQPKFNARSNKLFNELTPFDYFVQQFQSLMLKEKTPKEMLDEIAKTINTKLGAKV